MSDNEVFEIPETETKKKVKKPRKPMSDERKEQLREQLKTAREKSAEARQKKALVKKIDKEEEQKKLDEKIAKKVLNKNPLEEEINNLKEEIKSLRASGTSNNSDEVKQLREELNLFKKCLAEEIKKAKAQQADAKAQNEVRQKNEVVAKAQNEVRQQQQQYENKTEIMKDGTSVNYAVKPKICSSRFRGGYKN